MRYENWDVLIFPEGTKVPLQEFKTQCFVIKDTSSPYLQNQSIGGHSYYPVQGNYGQFPVLTSFVPSMNKDSPYRFSIHSWEKPRPSRLIEGMMQPDDLLMYEARVFVDGDCVAGGFFSQRTQWPWVIGKSLIWGFFSDLSDFQRSQFSHRPRRKPGCPSFPFFPSRDS